MPHITTTTFTREGDNWKGMSQQGSHLHFPKWLQEDTNKEGPRLFICKGNTAVCVNQTPKYWYSLSAAFQHHNIVKVSTSASFHWATIRASPVMKQILQLTAGSVARGAAGSECPSLWVYYHRLPPGHCRLELYWSASLPCSVVHRTEKAPYHVLSHSQTRKCRTCSLTNKRTQTRELLCLCSPFK